GEMQEDDSRLLAQTGSPDLPRQADSTYGHLPAATSSSFRTPARSPSASDAPTRMTSFSTANGLQAKLTRALPGPGYFASTTCGSSSLACSAATAKLLPLSPSRIRWLSVVYASGSCGGSWWPPTCDVSRDHGFAHRVRNWSVVFASPSSP